VQDVAEKLARFGQGRICLYGPPGTGKTAFGRYLAEKLERRLIVKRASDILGCYVGETEKQIAAMFAEAAEEKAVLLLDEADSFLQARDKAVRSWEITQINEMLTQMEQFEGIFIASTNFMDALDEATLRRFDLKVKFLWLAPNQIEHLFSDTAGQLEVPHDAHWLARTQEISTLTPGDFANVLRQARLRCIDTAEALHAALLAEVKARPRNGQALRIGF
jgi:SpoVK/Ycf46/Vps4 family AAA+-type ATPase